MLCSLFLRRGVWLTLLEPVKNLKAIWIKTCDLIAKENIV